MTRFVYPIVILSAPLMSTEAAASLASLKALNPSIADWHNFALVSCAIIQPWKLRSMTAYDRPIPIYKHAPTAGNYQGIPIDAHDPRYAEALVACFWTRR
jgi:hypothetical protein